MRIVLCLVLRYSQKLVKDNIKNQEYQRKAQAELAQLKEYRDSICERLQKLQTKVPENINNISDIIKSIQKIETIDEKAFLSFIENKVTFLEGCINVYDFSNEVHNLLKFIINKNSINNQYLYEFNKLFGETQLEMLNQIKKFGELNDVLKNHKTYEIYKKSEDGNHKKYKFYIYWAIGLAVVGFILSIFSKVVFTKCLFGELCFLEYNNIDYWIMKVSIIFITITGITFCLKQAIHHQKKKDRAEQTRLELEALPTYMFNFTDEQKNQVYAELTSKYFGRDFDKDGYQDMSNLVQEQIKLSHEVLKTTISNQKTGNQSTSN